MSSTLFLHLLFLGLFNGHYSINPESVLVQSPEDNNERTGKIQREEGDQKAFISLEGPRVLVVRYMRPVITSAGNVWREVYRERVDRIGNSNPAQDTRKDDRIRPWNSRRTTERTIINGNRRTNLGDTKPQMPQNRVTENNNNQQNSKTLISTPVTTENVVSNFDYENSENVITKSPKKISPDSNFFAGIVNDFAFKLVETLNLESNFVISPLSIFIALSMCYLGSDGRTKAQMEQAMGMNDNAVHGERFHEGIKNLLDLVMEETSGHEIFAANGMFLAKNFTADAQFIQNIKNYYDAEIENLDFGNPMLSLDYINKWVSENTNNMITSMLNSPPPLLTRLILLNAIYFKGYWKKPFPPRLTDTGKFHLLNGKDQEIQIMKIYDGTFPVFRSDEHKHSFIKLPYEGDDVSMIIALPYDTLEKPMPSITDQILCTVRDAMVDTNLGTVGIPKFRLEYKKSLIRPLQQLGITDIFNNNAVNFSKLRKENDIYVTGILQKAVVEVNEMGTTASASTSVNFVGLSYRNNTKFVADHPFAFYIVHEPTGLVQFYGKVFNFQTDASDLVGLRNPKPNSQYRG